MKHKIIFRGIRGSQAYKLSTPESDIDFAGVYIQSEEEILSGKYEPQFAPNKDSIYYEIRRFLELLSKANPNALEILFLPESYWLEYTPEWEFLVSERKVFVTMQCYNTYTGYANTQLKKSRGLNKKANWAKKRIERKTIIDFSKVIARDNFQSEKLTDWLEREGRQQNQLGLVGLQGHRDGYLVYTDELQWLKDQDNPRYKDVEVRGYRGVGDEDSNEPRVSEIEKFRRGDWVAVLYFNREEYSSHCREYKEYQTWLKERNENRYVTNKSHGQVYDSKNVMHLVRLIMEAEYIAQTGELKVDQSDQREYLLKIKRGEVDLKSIVDEWAKKSKELKEKFQVSGLPEEASDTAKLELKLRRYE